MARNSLRILVFSIYYAPEVTANGPYVTGVAEHWASQGHQVVVVTADPHYPQWRRAPRPRSSAPNPKVRRYGLYVPKVHNAVSRLGYELSWLLSASRGLLFATYDVCVGVSPTLSGAVLAYLAGKRFRIPFGLVLQDLVGQAADQSGYRGSSAVARYVQAVEKAVARRAGCLAIAAENFRPYLEGAGASPERIVRIRNWSHWVEPDESVEEVRRRLGWPPSAFVCLHAGNMGQKQGLDNLIACAALLRGKDVRIVLAGDGNDRERLMLLARGDNHENVSFITALQPEGQFSGMLRAADVLLLNQRPSVSDMALPSKLAAYFAAGRPVLAAVAADSNAALELQLARAGVIVAPGKPAELAMAIHDLKANPGLRAQLGANGAAYANRYLDRDEALAGYDRVLQRLGRKPTLT